MANVPFSFSDPNGFFRIHGTVFGGKKPHISVTGVFDTPLAGLNAKKLKGIFKIDPSAISGLTSIGGEGTPPSSHNSPAQWILISRLRLSLRPPSA